MSNYDYPQKKRSWGRIIINVLFVLSIIANFFLLFAVIGLGIMVAGGSDTGLIEETIVRGPESKKIAIINLDGIISHDSEVAVKDQIESAKWDDSVKGLVLKVNTPGGGVSSSDNIHHFIKRYKEQTGKPVICYMDGLATSGGYYIAVACDKIVASPTTITGSIGVIMGHFDISKLLNEKLGISATTIKSGERKDWPNIFRELGEEEKVYLYNKVIEPAYDRFTKLVDQGRENLTMDEVTALADGSIYFADEAQSRGLVDQLGYFENALSILMEDLGLENAKVVQYKRPFSFSNIFASSARSSFSFDSSTIYKLLTPELMYLWNGKQ